MEFDWFFHIRKRQPPVPILSQSNPVHASVSYFLKSISLLSSHICLSLPLGLPTKTLYAPLLSAIRATWPTSLIILDLITQEVFAEEYRV